MKVGMVGYGLGRGSGGIGRYTIELFAALRRHQVPCTLLRTAGPPAAGEILMRGARLLPGLLTLGQVEIARISRRRGFELVHDPTGVVPLALTASRKIVTIHDVVPYIYPETSSTLDWLIYRFWLPWVTPLLDAVVTVSARSKADIVHHLPICAEKVVIIPEAAGRQFRPSSKTKSQPVLRRYHLDHPFILYVGSIAPRKNLRRLLEAFADLRRWSTRWQLVIVGARKWKSSPIYQAVERLGLAGAVRFAGFVPEKDLPALYNGADLFVFPTLYEGFGLPVLEAMASGTPVITTNTSSLPAVAGDAALLVDPYNVEEIAAAMRRVLADAALAQDLRARGLARAAQFSWERTARETVAVYEKVCGRKGLGVDGAGVP